MAAQKKPPQIRHLAAENRKQFRVRAVLCDKALPGAGNPGIKNGHSYPSRVSTAHNSRKGERGIDLENLSDIGLTVYSVVSDFVEN